MNAHATNTNTYRAVLPVPGTCADEGLIPFALVSAFHSPVVHEAEL